MQYPPLWPKGIRIGQVSVISEHSGTARKAYAQPPCPLRQVQFPPRQSRLRRRTELPLGRRNLSARIAERREYHIADHADDMPRGVDHVILKVERFGERR